jgi:hypothetical protein
MFLPLRASHLAVVLCARRRSWSFLLQICHPRPYALCAIVCRPKYYMAVNGRMVEKGGTYTAARFHLGLA